MFICALTLIKIKTSTSTLLKLYIVVRKFYSCYEVKQDFVARPFNQNANDYKTVQCTYFEISELQINWFPHKFLQNISMVTFCGILYEKI